MNLAAGSKLGPYEIQSPLGVGEKAEVYCPLVIRSTPGKSPYRTSGFGRDCTRPLREPDLL